MADRNAVGRFLVFAGYDYYPSGGWHDLCGSFDCESKAIEYAKSRGSDFWHVVDLRGARIVAEDEAG